MLRCVKHRPSREERQRSESPGLFRARHGTRHARSGSTTQLDSEPHPDKSTVSKKSATLAGHTVRPESTSRSSSKSKSPNVFNVSQWRTLSLSSLFSSHKRRKQDESGMTTSSGFVSPSEPLASTSESISVVKRPKCLRVTDGGSHSQLISDDTGQSTPTEVKKNMQRGQFSFDTDDDNLEKLTELAIKENIECSEVPTPTQSHHEVCLFATETEKISVKPVLDHTADKRSRCKLFRKRRAKSLSRTSENEDTECTKTEVLNASLLRAARSGKTEKLLELLNSNADVDAMNSSGLTALHVATKEGHLDAVKALLDHGASLEKSTKKGNTALHIASLAGHEDIVEVLIARGANVNCQSQNGFTPLYMAAQEDHVNVIQHLLDNNANPALATEDGFTPLAVALQQGNERAVALLVERDTRGKTRLPALHIAAKKNDVQATRLLLHEKDAIVDHASASGFTPLHIAAHYGSVKVANLLVERGANVNYCAKNAITPLHVAAKWGREGVVTELLKAGAMVDARTKDGLSPLHCAARSGHCGVVKMLLKAGADVKLKTKNDLTPLHMAAQGDHEAVARTLLRSGADPDAISVECLTPLHVTAHCGKVNCAKALLDYNCNVNARALNGFTPLHVASKKANVELMEMLLNNGATIEATTETGLTPLHVAAFVGSPDAIALLVNHGSNVNHLSVRGENPLHLVARNGQLDSAKTLIDNHVELNAQSLDGHTPLHIAIRSRQPAMVHLLLDAGANPNVYSKEDYTALHLASMENSDEVVQDLLNHGAQAALKTKKGYTPLHLTAKQGNLPIAKSLLEKAKLDPNTAARNWFTPVHVAAYYNRPSVLGLLLDHGGDPNKQIKNGFTPLHLATKRGNKQCVSVLCEFQAAIDARSKSGYTPLHLCAQRGDHEIAELLIKRFNANPGACAADGLTPMHVAIQEDHVAVAQVLLNSGASLTATTEEAKFTPLHIAAFRGHMQSLRFLLSNIPESQWPKAINTKTRMGSTALHLAAQQGHLPIVLKLLQCGADPNIRNTGGWTAAHLAYKQNYKNLFEKLSKVTTGVTDWSVPSLSDGLPNGNMNLTAAGSVMFDRLDRVTDQVLSDSDDESGDVLSTPAFLRRQVPRKQSLTNGDVEFPRSTSYDILYEQLQYMKTRLGDADEGSAPGTPKSRDKHEVDRARDTLASAEVHKAKEVMTKTETQPLKSEHVEQMSRDSKLSPASPPDTSRYPVGTTHAEMAAIPSTMELTRKPIKAGFLISFLVDACGCVVEAKRRADLRFFVPPNALPGPIRIICRVLRPEFSPVFPGFNDGEGFATRIIELNPTQMQFDLPVMIEVPHIAWLQGGEREIVVARSESGASWKEHPMVASDDAVKEALGKFFDRLEDFAALRNRQIHRILTYDFPKYFALLTRFRQEFALVGADGGILASNIEPRVQALFPPGSLQKRIRVGLQVQLMPQNVVSNHAGSQFRCSPVVSIEPRRRKFHKPITLKIPFHRSKPSLRNSTFTDNHTVYLLRSLAGGINPAVWENITEQTALNWSGDCVSFTTTFSARFWLIESVQQEAPIELASIIYKEASIPPITGRFVVFGRQPLSLSHATDNMDPEISSIPVAQKPSPSVFQFRCLCLTDDNEDKTLECLERFSLLAVGPSVKLFENHTYWIKVTGALVPITSGKAQPKLLVRPFRENRVTFPVRICRQDERCSSDAYINGTVTFLHDSRLDAVNPDETQEVVTTLDVRLPRPGQSMMVATAEDEILGRSELDRTTLARQLSGDWKLLAPQLGFTPDEVESISRTATAGTEQEHADLLLRMWQQKAVAQDTSPDHALGNLLADALHKINRSDVIHPSMKNVRPIVSRDEMALATSVLDRLPKLEEVKDAKPVSDVSTADICSAASVTKTEQLEEVPSHLTEIVPTPSPPPPSSTALGLKDRILDFLGYRTADVSVEPEREEVELSTGDAESSYVVVEPPMQELSQRSDDDARVSFEERDWKEFQPESEQAATGEEVETLTELSQLEEKQFMSDSSVITPSMDTSVVETGVPQFLSHPVEGDQPDQTEIIDKSVKAHEPPTTEDVTLTKVPHKKLEPLPVHVEPGYREEVLTQDEVPSPTHVVTTAIDSVLIPRIEKQTETFEVCEDLRQEMAGSPLPAPVESLSEQPEFTERTVGISAEEKREISVDTSDLSPTETTQASLETYPLTRVASEANGFEQVYFGALQAAESEEQFYDIEDTFIEPPLGEALEHVDRPPLISEAVSFPTGSAGHDVVQSSPEQSHTIEEVQEVLPDGTIVKSRTATEETVQSVTCRDWQEGVEAALESGRYSIQEPDERTEVEEVEEVLPDGTIITRLITTKYVVDRVLEQAVSDELVGSLEIDDSHESHPPQKMLEIRLL